jgi:hypothetical protein
MSSQVIDKLSYDIVLVGKFNPLIFQPAWLEKEGLITKREADNSKITLMHADIVIFALDYCSLEITQERFFIKTQDETYLESMRDLIVGSFRLLRHTPVYRMGINKHVLIKLSSIDEWHAAGHRLAPKELWEGILEKPGTRSLTMEGVRNDGLTGYLRVIVGPSETAEYGIYINVNDHYEVKEQKISMGCDEIINILESNWKLSLKKSQNIIDVLYSRLI